MKLLHTQRQMPGRKIVVSATRGMWDGSTGKARCSGCPLSYQYKRDEAIPERCARCGALLIHTGDIT